MKKIFSLLLVFVSLLGVFLLCHKAYLNFHEKKLFSLPEIPAGLSVQISPREISVSPAVPILMYHHIQEYPGGNNPSSPSIFVSPAQFESQLQWLSENNFQTVNLDYLRHPIKLSGKPVILTFDDGYQDAYDTVFPILEKQGMQATFYPIVNNIDKSGFLTENEMQEMQKSGMHFGSHSLSHPDLTSIPEQQAQQEIYASKKILEQITGTNVTDFCYPGGTVDRHVETIVANSGYETAVTTVNESNVGSIDPLRLNRLDITNETNFEDLSALKNL